MIPALNALRLKIRHSWNPMVCHHSTYHKFGYIQYTICYMLYIMYIYTTYNILCIYIIYVYIYICIYVYTYLYVYIYIYYIFQNLLVSRFKGSLPWIFPPSPPRGAVEEMCSWIVSFPVATRNFLRQNPAELAELDGDSGESGG